MVSLRKGEFKLRQLENRPKLTPEQRRNANKLVRQGFSKKAVVKVFGCSYKDLKL